MAMVSSGAALGLALSRQVSAYCPHHPTPKQAAALVALELRQAVLYGGAAGGGKTDWLLMAALQYVDRPGYHAIIFRRTYPQLNTADGPILRLTEWLAGTGANWSQQNHRWTFPSGATITLGHMQYVKDRLNYQGAAYQFIGFDELTHFDEAQFTYLFSRARRPKVGPGSSIPIRVGAATNPGGPGHTWVSKAWGLGEWKGNAQGLGKVHADLLAFISAKLEDNPHLDAKKYEQSLMFLPEIERLQLLHGDWNTRARGDLVPIERMRIIDPASVPDGLRTVRFWDFAATGKRASGRQPDYTASVKAVYDKQIKVFFILDATLDQLEPGGVETLVLDTTRADGDGVEQHMEQEPGASGKTVIRMYQKLLRGYRVVGHPASGSKRSRWLGYRAVIEQEATAMARGRYVKQYQDHLAALTSDEAADEKADIKDDGMDAGAGAFRVLTGVIGEKRAGYVGSVTL